MEHNEDERLVVIEGLEVIIERDLEKHKALLKKRQEEKLAFIEARSYVIQRKKMWNKHLKGDNGYDKEALRRQMNEMAVDIRKWSDRLKLAQDGIEHETLIVDTLSEQLKDQYKGLRLVAEARNKERALNKN
jgi:hypothetical protein